jgi:hypothetical protein
VIATEHRKRDVALLAQTVVQEEATSLRHDNHKEQQGGMHLCRQAAKTNGAHVCNQLGDS